MMVNRCSTTCFGPIYWPSSGWIINLISSYTIYAWVTLEDKISSYATRAQHLRPFEFLSRRNVKKTAEVETITNT
jgi:hypothetical protein